MVCKLARVKCDEQKPNCARCVRLGLACRQSTSPDPAPKQPQQHQGKNLRQLLPSNCSSVSPRPIPRQPPCSFFDPEEGLYFDFFRKRVAHRMDGDIEMTSFWTRTVLQESTRDKTVLNAVVAISALARARMLVPNHESPLDLATSSGAGRIQYLTAIQYYTRALADFRRRILPTMSEGSYRTVLIVTVLFIAFELCNVNTAAADKLAANAIHLLKDKLVQSQRDLSKSALAASIDDQGIVEAEFFLIHTATLCSKATTTLESDQGPKGLTSILAVDWCFHIPEPPEHYQGIKVLFGTFWRFVTAVFIWHFRMLKTQAQGHSLGNEVEWEKQQSHLITRARS
jgi:hypothetical protein